MRRQALLLGLLAIAAFAVTWLVEPNLIIGLRSPRALALALGLGLLCGATGLAVHRLTRRPMVALVAAALPALIVTAVVVVRPILNPRTVNEALPEAAAPTATAAPVASTSSGDSMGTGTSSPAAKPATGSSSPAAKSPTGPTGPTRIATGELRGLAGHDARGRVSTYRLADGSHVVRFEDVDIGGTPSPHVYVLPGADQRDKGGVHLGKLTAEKGSFNYRLPASFDPEDFTVLVWCEQFAVEIANATQA